MHRKQKKTTKIKKYNKVTLPKTWVEAIRSAPMEPVNPISYGYDVMVDKEQIGKRERTIVYRALVQELYELHGRAVYDYLFRLYMGKCRGIL